MLRELRVKNLKLIDDLHLTLGEGLNVLTGETGSGKSVIVGALGAALGHKTAGQVVRDESSPAIVEAVFHWHPADDLVSKLLDAGIAIDEDDDTIILSREISPAGRSSARINSRAVPAALLREVGDALIDMHGQHQQQTLLRASTHTRFLDLLGSDKHRSDVRLLAEIHARLASLKKSLADIETSRLRIEEERDLLAFRVSEIQEIVGDGVSLEDMMLEARRLENAADIVSAASAARAALTGDDGDISAAGAVAQAAISLVPFEGIDPSLDEARVALQEADNYIDMAIRALRNCLDSLDADPARLIDVQDSIIEIKALLKKNRCETTSDLLAFRDSALKRISEIENIDESAAGIESQIAATAKSLDNVAARVSKARRDVAKKMEKRMAAELADLAMTGARFVIEFVPASDTGMPSANGAETARFLISSNPGETPMPLCDIVSGGELSRVMLAFKTILRELDPVPVLVFDEIDTGIGGVTAKRIGLKMAAIASHRQVIAITHLTQIAAFADNHITVFKQQSGNRTVIRSETVSDYERVLEIIRMLGGEGATEDAANHAKNILTAADRERKEYIK